MCRKLRFQTESRNAGNAAGAKFKVASIRMLPGTPKALEAFRERTIERYGILAICAMKYYLGSGTIETAQLRTGIKDLGTKISPLEINQVNFIFSFLFAFPVSSTTTQLVICLYLFFLW